LPFAASSAISTDWLLTLIARISGETPPGIGDELRLTEDLHLDSLGRVQLAAAIEERAGIATETGLLDHVQTLGEVRSLIGGEAMDVRTDRAPTLATEIRRGGRKDGARRRSSERTVGIPPGGMDGSTEPIPLVDPKRARYIYPRWPWMRPFRWLRTAYVEAVERPLVWLLANPAVIEPQQPIADEPILIVANHVTTYDGPLLQYALPGPIRRNMAVAMSGEMLEDLRHFRNHEPGPRHGRLDFFGPFQYLLLTAFYNVFPLPRLREFQRSFAHAGKALDNGFNVLVFHEGRRSAAGELARFRPGIGLLAKQSGAAVLPMAIRGLGELKAGRRRWFRSGTIEVRVGQPIRFAPEETEAAIAARLHAEVDKLLG
jgi:long-chain acyl-CoA synthetase